MVSFVQSLSSSRLSWVALLILGIVLECCGLYFQYGLRLDPCVNCVYERAFYLSFILAGLIGFLSPSFILTRLLAILIFLAGIISGGWLPLPIALLISTITGGFSGYLFAEAIVRRT